MTIPTADATAEATAKTAAADTELAEDTAPEADEGQIPDPTPADEDRVSDVTPGDADTFPRAYVEKLRAQNARYREKAKNADAYGQRLHTELVRATGRLADPSDLDFDPEHLDDPEALAAAVNDLLARKPHLASRKPVGDIGQGVRGSATEQAGLLSILKGLT